MTLKGKAGYTLAIWSSEGYSYSLSLSSPLDMSGWQAGAKLSKGIQRSDPLTALSPRANDRGDTLYQGGTMLFYFAAQR